MYMHRVLCGLCKPGAACWLKVLGGPSNWELCGDFREGGREGDEFKLAFQSERMLTIIMNHPRALCGVPLHG
jgi:hypothetical protein